MGIPRLTYFAGRGLCETTRILLALAEIEVEEINIRTKKDWQDIRASGKLKFKLIPLLEIDGLCLIESNAISVYVARKYGLAGKTLEDEGRILMAFQGARSFLTCGVAGFMFQDAEGSEKMKANVKKMATTRYLPAFEKDLKDNGSGYLVGTSPTLADCGLLDVLTNISQIDDFKYLLDDFPLCQEFIKKMSEVKGIKAYFASPRRFPIAHAEYVKEVNACKF